MKDNNSNNKEYRAYDSRMQVDEEKRTVEGYAAVFNSEATIGGWFREVIDPGAFNKALTSSDVRALFNHDPNMILARKKPNKNGTLELWVDQKGLGYRFEAPNNTAGNDLLESLARGDIDQSSFGFTVRKELWEEEKGKTPLRRIQEVELLFDVSPVTYPAYKDTSVAKRSMDQWKEEKRKAEEANQKPKNLNLAKAKIILLRARQEPNN